MLHGDLIPDDEPGVPDQCCKPPSLGIGQVDSGLSESGILNIECAVRPPQRRSDAIPEDATHNTIHP
jgi:hypothetical protein